MSLSEVNQLGTPEDIERRAQLARMDDNAYRRTIKAARNLIFNHRHAVDSREVEDLLKAQSWTPTAVSTIEPHHSATDLNIIIERVFKKTWTPWIQHFQSALSRLHA